MDSFSEGTDAVVVTGRVCLVGREIHPGDIETVAWNFPPAYAKNAQMDSTTADCISSDNSG